MSSGGFFRINPEKWLFARGPWRRRKAQKLVEAHFRAPDFFLAGLDEAWIPEKMEVLSADELPKGEPTPPKKLQWSEANRELFFETHQQILTSIRQSEFQKMVPFTEFRAKGVLSPLFMMNHMKNLPANFFPYGYWSEDGGMIGATPELLYYRKGTLLKTMALAGTAPVGDEEKLNTAKERNEHQLVIDGLKEVLSSFGEVRVGETKIVSYTHLCHLKTEVEAELRADVLDEHLIRALHPTAALGGWPREASRKWHSENLLSCGRGGFGAPMVISYGDEVWVLVAIRGVQWQGSDLCLRVGCGVVEGSEALSEWQELALKKRATLRGLGLGD